MDTLSANWEKITKLLREARDCLATAANGGVPSVPAGPLTGTLDEFQEFFDHNELELAWDSLATVADRVSASPACWRKLACAAGLMHLLEKEEAAAGRAVPAIPCDQALGIARQDAEKAYRELFAFRIVITMESDGWHIDFELREPRMCGGGPHYVIDPQNGAILSKRYEQ